MHFSDIGTDSATFECKKCGTETGWLVVGDLSITAIKRGIPCPGCNK